MLNKKMKHLILKAALLIFYIISGNVLAQSITKPANIKSTPSIQYRIINERYCYELINRPRQNNTWPKNELIQREQGEDLPHAGPWFYNWVARRDPIFLVSGDLPRVAMMRTFRNPDVNPSFAVLGDLRVMFHYKKQNYWLDEQDSLNTFFYPWGTVHKVNFSPKLPLKVEMVSCLVNHGIAVLLRISSAIKPAAPTKNIGMEVFYGGVTVKEPSLTSAYIVSTPEDAKNNLIKLLPEGGDISASLNMSSPMYKVRTPTQVMVRVLASPIDSVGVNPPNSSERMDNRIVFYHRIKTVSKPQEFRLLAFPIEPTRNPAEVHFLKIEKFDKYVREGKLYYDSLLSTVKIQTPDTILNAAFYTSVVNLDYLYQKPAWLEGLHKWNSYFGNNYQLSAAIELGQLNRVRKALLFVGDRPGGPCPPILPDGSIFTRSNLNYQDGLPYYILQLYRYWRASNDIRTLNQLWPKLVKNLNNVLRDRDPDGDMLLNWKFGTNMFLYQGDHLFLPGDAVSPTLMLANNLEEMSVMALSCGTFSQARQWQRRAKYMRNEVVRRLWDPEEGKFIGCIDPQGQRMKSNFYTDFVYPQLYSILPYTYSWLSLRALDEKLWVGNHLMRVGNFKPDLFGNDQVMPTQMSEASEAYFQVGRASRGVSLLHGVALAATILTNSPGSFPERMSDSGFGQPDYCFGNPAGAYLHAVVGGLFGMERTAKNFPLRWQPAIPAGWKSATLSISGLQMIIKGRQGNRTYTLKIDNGPQPVRMRIPLYGQKLDHLTDGHGHDISYTLVPSPGGGFLELHLAASTKFIVHLISHAYKDQWQIPSHVTGGSKVVWLLPKTNMSVNDPQGAFSDFNIVGDVLTGHLTLTSGRRTIFIQNAKKNRILPFDLDFGSSPPPSCYHRIAGKREHLDLTDLFNSASLKGQNFWMWGPLTIDLRNRIGPKGMLSVGSSTFKVRPNGKNLVLLELGNLWHSGDDLSLSDKPNSIHLKIGKSIRGLEFLMASEFQIRLTDMKVGELVIQYSDGAKIRIPLIYGRNIDGTIKPFATQVKSYKLSWLRHLAVSNFQVDSKRRIDWVEMHITSMDGSIAILAVNLIDK